MRATLAAALLLACAFAAQPAAAATDQDPCMPDPDAQGTGACVVCDVAQYGDYYDCLAQACLAGVYTDYTAYQHPDRLEDRGYYGGYTQGDFTCGGPLAQPYQDAIDLYRGGLDPVYGETEPVRDLACPLEADLFGTQVGADC